ncbi:homoprotocatechuate degradation operon regulator HpaR [Maritalea porphyrae]|uniref:homoprotocatechuate degradation operon regulator HpaR n=1 Tax=Maritalea porphyrae TaxID=880732 RepID=UPI0022AEA5B0|nr:homoprotocatechuate degradation operon regulator HpaR [Maritalea porphyrae]MCZ4272814.1 homoprotocatechuate degradation operon regulator HpaR [Maritalea porphyrae]
MNGENQNMTAEQLLEKTNRSLPIVLLRARESVMAHFRPMLAAHGLTEQQWRVLRVLSEAGELDASHLAHHACILPPSLTRMLKTLEGNGWIVGRRDKNDGRRMLFSATEEGLRFIATVSPKGAAIYEEIVDAFGEDKLRQLVDLLDELQTKVNGAAK